MKHVKLQMLVSGLLVIAAGVLLVLFNSGALPMEYRSIIFSWPMLLIAIGFSFLFGGLRKSFPGIVLMLVGGLFLLRRMDYACGFITRENIWATVLVVVGILIVVKACFFHAFHKKFHDPEKMREWQEKHPHFNNDDCCGKKHGRYGRYGNRRFDRENSNGIDYIDRACIFGGSRERVTSQNFKGGEINCIFGSLKLDLTAAQLAEGENYLEISTIFGGIELIIPADWHVELHQTNVFGGFADKRPKATFEVADNRRLVLEIASIFGGGEIKSHE